MVRNPYQIKMLKHDDGERLPILICRDTGFPVDSINSYLIYNRRPNAAANTLKKDLEALAYLFIWGKTKRIDIMTRLQSGEGFTSDEIQMSLYPFLRKDFNKMREEEVVTRNTILKRLLTVKKFINHFMDKRSSRLPLGDVRIDHIQSKIKSIDNAFNSLEPSSSHHEEREGLSDRKIDLLLQVIHPDSSDNPWKRKNRKRNALIVYMLLSFGLRPAELLKIYVQECELNSPVPGLRIKRKPNDVNDPRDNEPNVKTESRLLPVDDFMALKLDEYILRHRSKIPNSHKSPYLILNSNNGRPLSYRQVNYIIHGIEKRFPKEFSGFCPYILRHTAATSIVTISNEKGIDDERTKTHLKYLAGWLTDNSPTYTKRAIRQECHNLTIEHQRRLFSPSNNFDGLEDDVPF